MSSNIRVLIAHDSLFAAQCLSMGIQADPDICVPAIAEEAETIGAVTQHLPDILLIDLASPWPAALRLATEVSARIPLLKIILLGVPPDESHIIDCIKAGAKGWLPRSASLREIQLTVKNINDGKFFWPPRLAHIMFRCLSELAATSPLTADLSSVALTSREIQVMQLLAEEKSNQHIAITLHLSVHAVKKHVHNILEKLQLSNRAQLAKTSDSSIGAELRTSNR